MSRVLLRAAVVTLVAPALAMSAALTTTTAASAEVVAASGCVTTWTAFLLYNPNDPKPSVTPGSQLGLVVIDATGPIEYVLDDVSDVRGMVTCIL